jgi:HAD superfamily hydrolase (TIGR01509 family)
MQDETSQCVLFDWGNTVMRNFTQFEGPMHSWPRVEPVPGIHTALQVLRRSSTLALATNAVDSDENDIRMALQRCNLSDFFDHVFCFRQLGVRKPEAAFFSGIVDRLGLLTTQVFMVGDDLHGDVLAANAVGLPAVWFNATSDQSHSGVLCRTVHNLSDLPSALHELGARVC